MQILSFPFQTLDWFSIPKEKQKRETGIVTSQAGIAYSAGESSEAHRSSTKTGGKLFIVE